MNLPKIHTETQYLHVADSGSLILLHSDSTDSNFTCIGSVEIKVDVPPVTHNGLVEKKVEALKNEKTKVLGEMQHKIDLIDDKINSLLALEAPQ